MKVIISESQYNRLIDNFITFLFEPYEIKTHSEFSNSTFWVKNGEVIAQIENSEDFWLSNIIWKQISDQFEFDYDETKLVISSWLKQHYGLGELSPDSIGWFRQGQWHHIMDSWDSI